MEYEDDTSDPASNYIHYIGETHTPAKSATNVQVEDWLEDEDYDICGETYEGDQKIIISNIYGTEKGGAYNGIIWKKIIVD